ncbi:MAG: ABC transporter permease subunit [Sulfolobales archaeon]
MLAITGWPGVARIVRAHSLQILSTGYVEAARALGASSWHIALRHLVPASIPVTLAAIVTTTRAAVLLEAGLGFLGLSDPSTISLGTILFYARRSAALASGAWWVIVPAGLLITIIVFALTMISIGIEGRTLKRGQVLIFMRHDHTLSRFLSSLFIYCLISLLNCETVGGRFLIYIL